MEVVCYSPGSWWYLLRHADQFFLDVAFEYFGTTKSNCFRVSNEIVLDSHQKKDFINAVVFVDQTIPGLNDLARTAEYLSHNLSPSVMTDVESDLLLQIQQTIANFNRSN